MVAVRATRIAAGRASDYASISLHPSDGCLLTCVLCIVYRDWSVLYPGWKTIAIWTVVIRVIFSPK